MSRRFSLFAFVFLSFFSKDSCCFSSYCCCCCSYCCCGWMYLKTFNSARWVLLLSNVGVAPDSFLIYLSPLSPAEKLLCIVLACCFLLLLLLSLLLLSPLTNYAWKCGGQEPGREWGERGVGGGCCACVPVWGSALRSSELYQLNLYCPQTQKLIYLAAFVYPVM